MTMLHSSSVSLTLLTLLMGKTDQPFSSAKLGLTYILTTVECVIMPSRKRRLLEDFQQLVDDLYSFVRSRESLTENEQLFIENWLMILQLEYSRWAKSPVQIVRVPKEGFPSRH
jgi:hypothetical protein